MRSSRSHSLPLQSLTESSTAAASVTATTAAAAVTPGALRGNNTSRRQRSHTVTFNVDDSSSSKSSSDSDMVVGDQLSGGGDKKIDINHPSGWLPRTPHRGGSQQQQQQQQHNNNSHVLLPSASAGATPHQALSHQKPINAAGASTTTPGKDAVKLQKGDGQQQQQQQQQQEQLPQQEHSEGDSSSGGIHYEVLFPPSRPQFPGLIYDGDCKLDREVFRSSLPTTAFQPNVQKSTRNGVTVMTASGSCCRHQVIAVEGGDSAFVPLMRSAVVNATDEELRIALPKCFDLFLPQQHHHHQQQEDPVAFFRKHIIPAEETRKISNHKSTSNGNKQPNCMAISIRAGIPNRSEETIRCIVTTAIVLDGETFVLDPLSVFRAFDDERWVAADGVPDAMPLLSATGSSSIWKRLVGETAVPRRTGEEGAVRPAVELARWPKADYHHGIGGNVKQQVRMAPQNRRSEDGTETSAAAEAASPLLVTYPARLLELRPCAALNGELEVVAGPLGVPYGTAFLYGGTLATPKQSRALAPLKEAAERARKQHQAAAASATSTAAAAASSSASLSSRKSASASNSGGGGGGGVAGAPSSSASSVAASSFTSNSNTKDSSAAATMISSVPSSAPHVDVERFIYSYEVGSHGRVILGNTVARYINHKLNFSPSGNVQFVNLPASKFQHLFQEAAVNPTPPPTPPPSHNNSSDDDDLDDDDAAHDSSSTVDNNEVELTTVGSEGANDDDDDIAVALSSDDDDDDDADAGSPAGDGAPAVKKSKQGKKAASKKKVTSKNNKKSTKSKQKKKSKGDASSGSGSGSSSHGSEIVLPFFLVSRDLAPGEPLLADSYGSSYDSEMERYIACGGAPLSAADVEAIYFLKERATQEQQQQQQQQQQQRNLPQSLPNITCGYNACYRTGVDRGSIVACVNSSSAVSLFYVHAACWGELRQPASLVSPDDPLLSDDAFFFEGGSGAAALCGDGDDGTDMYRQQEDSSSLPQQQQLHDQQDEDINSLLFAGLKEEDVTRLATNKGKGTSVHSARLKKYVARSAQCCVNYEVDRVGQQQLQQQKVASAVRSCSVAPRFILAERLSERSSFTVQGEQEIDRLTADLNASCSSSSTAAPGAAAADITKSLAAVQPRVFYRAASPGKLHAKSSESKDAVSVAISILNSSNPAAVMSQQQQQLASSLSLLDASSCVLLLPQRDGIWPVTLNAKETGIKQQQQQQQQDDLECLILTAAQQLVGNSFAANGDGGSNSAAAHDVALFSHLRLLEPRIPKAKS